MSQRMTVGQALVEFLGRQWTVDGAHRIRTIPAMFGIFGHGNVAGIGQALLEANVGDPQFMPYHQARNEQAMVHQAVGYARMNRRRSTFACTTSIGPGSANMLTGAALATANRMPALLLPSDTFSTRVVDPALQQLEHPGDPALQVTDAFRPLSTFFARVERPEQILSIALQAMRVLTDPIETGAVTIALPQDVQAEELAVPSEFLASREWHIRRPLPEPGPLARAASAIREAKAPLIIAGGGVLYSEAEDVLRNFAQRTGIPVATTQAGGGVLDTDHPLNLGGIGATGTTAANRIAADADLVIGIGTRYSDFTTASRSLFGHPEVAFVNINVAPFDAYKHGTCLPVIADAAAALNELNRLLEDYRIRDTFAEQVLVEKALWTTTVEKALAPTGRELPGQAEIIGAVNRASDPRDVLVQAAGSLPGDLHKLWQVRDPLGYHVEYAFSCMGYEIAGGLGVRRAAPDRDVIVMVGDGSYLMLHSELATAVAEGLKIIVVLVQNHGFASIGNLSQSVGSQRFGTAYRELDPATVRFDGTTLPIDLAANARSYGVNVIEIAPGAAMTELEDAVRWAKASSSTTLIHISADPQHPVPDGEGWWDVPVAQTSQLASTNKSRERYVEAKRTQRPLLGPS